jgi:hypothetical protein
MKSESGQTFDVARMSMLGRIGAYTTHARHDAKATTAKARAPFLATFEKQVDPNGSLPPEERAKRAEAARRAHFARMALASAEARRGRKGART